MKPLIIAPSILASDYGKFAAEACRVQDAGADWLHLDIMDGHFVDNISFGSGVVAAIGKVAKVPLDVHLMISRPDHYWPRYREAGATNITVHVEAEHDVQKTLSAIKNSGSTAGLALNPGTDFQEALPYLAEIDLLLVMTVNPGFGGQPFIAETMSKVQAAREARQRLGLTFHIEVDGGINVKTASQAISHGANVLVAGTSVFGAPDAAVAITALKQSR